MKRSVIKYVVLSLLAMSSLASAEEGYNEIIDAQGTVRPEYQDVYKLWQDRHAGSQDLYLVESRKVFTGDNALDSMPRIIQSSDYDKLKKGVDQRARAIRAFLKDHYSGRRYYAQSGVIPSEVVERIIARGGEAGYKGLVNPSTLSFFYGPDIIKDSQGSWRVIEDNMGFIGGLGDLKLAQDLTLKTYPEIRDKFSARPAQDFYIKLANSFKARAKEHGGKAIMYMIATYASDNEEKRIAKIFSDLGIETVTPDTIKQLKVKADGVYLEMKDGRGQGASEKVGYIFLNAEHAWVDPSHPAAIQRNLIEEASALLKDKKISSKLKSEVSQALNDVDPATHIPNLGRLRNLLLKAEIFDDEKIIRKNSGLLDAILKSKVGTNYSPGVDFIGDKEFYVYMEDLIRLYLHEEPVLKNIDTKKFSEPSEPARVNEALVKQIFDNLQDYVIKKVDGRGGDSVWVGPKIKPNEIPGLLQSIRGNPDMYIVQKFTPLSTLNDNIVDLRVITDVSPKEIIITDTPWGRGLPKNGNGKVNLSDKGREITVLVVQPKVQMENSCSRVFAN